MGFNAYDYITKFNQSWVVGMNQIAYFAPVQLMERVVIQTRILEWNKTDMLMEFLMWNNDKSRLKSMFWSRMVYYDLKTQKRVEHSTYLNELFGPYEEPLPTNMIFEERVKSIPKK